MNTEGRLPITVWLPVALKVWLKSQPEGITGTIIAALEERRRNTES